ncbi:MAG: hypothetical protein EXS17_07705 [Phycisphaerales bacterium]|nr:hypothetical protein [Phycisphaerales bacterium]
MESSESKSCCSTKGSAAGSCCKGRLCGVIFKLLIVGLLACIASSLWDISQAIRMVSIATQSAGK